MNMGIELKMKIEAAPRLRNACADAPDDAAREAVSAIPDHVAQGRVRNGFVWRGRNHLQSAQTHSEGGRLLHRNVLCSVPALQLCGDGIAHSATRSLTIPIAQPPAMAVQSNNVDPPLARRGFYFCVSGAADKRYSLGSNEHSRSIFDADCLVWMRYG